MPCSWTASRWVLATLLQLLGEHLGGAVASTPVHGSTEYTPVTPRLYHGVDQTEMYSTLQEDGKHVHHVTMKYEMNGRKHTLDLVLNTELIPESYFEKYQRSDGYAFREPRREAEMCHYKGHIRGIPNSLAAVSTCDGISGAIFDGKDMHYLKRSSQHTQEDSELRREYGKLHFLNSHSDLQTNLECDTCNDTGETSSARALKTAHRKKRSSESVTPEPCYAKENVKFHIVELVFVVDEETYDYWGSNVYFYCQMIANNVNMVYAPVNIFIALAGVVVWSEKNEIDISSDIDVTVKNFLEYRRDVLLKHHPNDAAYLITRKNFSGSDGRSYTKTMCSPRYSGGVVTYKNSPIQTSSTLAHELGHNFGMEHDNENCSCDYTYECVMNPARQHPSLGLSSCSHEYLADYLSQGLDYCLHNVPKRIFQGPTCGNGFVEEGEECDCVREEWCNPCCDGHTCKLRPGAKCAGGPCCDKQTCDMKPAGACCRTANSECDVPEFCTGESEFCPDDVFKMNGEECLGAKAFCYNGQCRSHDSQCQLLWGPSGKSAPEECYINNIKGTRSGHCGPDGDTFKTCNQSDIACGLLHCLHDEGSLQSAVSNDAVRRAHYLYYKNYTMCESVLFDVGEGEIDPGLVPNGAKCGDMQMCINQTCVSVDEVREIHANCSRRVVCYLGFCHCVDFPPDDYIETPGEFRYKVVKFILGAIVVMVAVVLVVNCIRSSSKNCYSKIPSNEKASDHPDNKTSFFTRHPSGGCYTLIPEDVLQLPKKEDSLKANAFKHDLTSTIIMSGLARLEADEHRNTSRLVTALSDGLSSADPRPTFLDHDDYFGEPAEIPRIYNATMNNPALGDRTSCLSKEC